MTNETYAQREAALLDTIKRLEAEKVELGDQLGHFRHQFERQGQQHNAALDRQADEHKALVLSAQDRAEQLDIRLAEKDQQLEEQAIELAMLGWTQENPPKHPELGDYQRENARLLDFVQRVADSRTKFATDARELLGQ